MQGRSAAGATVVASAAASSPSAAVRGRAVVAAIAVAMLATPARAVEPEAMRARLGGALSTWHVFRLHADTPDEHPSGRLDLRLDAERGERFHLVTAMRLGYDGKIGDPNRGNPVLALDEIHQDKDLYVDFDEAFLGVLFEDFELRLGKQKISWGQLDDLQPTDHLNPEDLTEFYFRPELDRKVGIPAARLTGYRGPWTADLVWAPFYTAYRFPNRDDRWFPPLLTVPDRVDTPLGSLPVGAGYPDVDAPPHTLASSDVGFRVTRFVRGAEVSAMVFHGWDKMPTFGVRGAATVVPTGDPSAPAAPSVDLSIFPTLHRITVAGGDLAVPIWLLALRAEAAWIHGRAFPLLVRDQIGGDPALVQTVADTVARVARTGNAETVALPLPPAELERDSVQFGIGFDYSVSDRLSRRLLRSDGLAGAFALVQLIETIILDHDAPFISDRAEHLLAMTLRHAVWNERLLGELKVAYNANHGDYFVWPQLAYKLTPALHALLEARVIGGDRDQTIGQYRDWDGVRVGVRRLF